MVLLWSQNDEEGGFGAVQLMSGAQLRSAARVGDALEVARLLDGQFKGTQTSRRLDRLAVCVQRLLREHEQRHAAEPEAVPKFMTLEVLLEEYRRANDGAVLRPLDYGFRELAALVEALPSTCCQLTYPGDGVTAIMPAVQANSAAYNIAGGIPDARLRLPVNASDSNGRSALWWAAKGGQEEVVQLLLRRNAAAEVCDRSTGNTALLVAAAGGHAGVVQLLLKHGADPNAVNAKGNTAIMIARSREIAQALIVSGGDATIKNYVEQSDMSGGLMREPKKSGGPPRGHAAAQRSRMGATGRKLGSAKIGACEILSPFTCGPPNTERGVHFGSDRSEIAVWGTVASTHERTAADVQWSLGHKDVARFLEHHKTPQQSEQQAARLLAAGDSLGAAEAATVGLASIACSKRALLLDSGDMTTKMKAGAEYRQLEATQQTLKDLREQSRSTELRGALRRMKTTDLLKLSPTTATALVEDRRWMPMGNRGTSEQVEQRHIDLALAIPDDIEGEKETLAAQKKSMIETLLERHHAMLAARVAAAGQRDEAEPGALLHVNRATQEMSSTDSGRTDVTQTKSMRVRGMPAWN
eukprot:COSAG02_NODE_1719_length_11197_cov_12.067039_8_plen_584_part_00